MWIHVLIAVAIKSAVVGVFWDFVLVGFLFVLGGILVLFGEGCLFWSFVLFWFGLVVWFLLDVLFFCGWYFVPCLPQGHLVSKLDGPNDFWTWNQYCGCGKNKRVFRNWNRGQLPRVQHAQQQAENFNAHIYMIFLEALERWLLLWDLSFNLNKCHGLNCNLCYHSSKLLLLSCSLCLASHFLLLWVAVAQEMSFTSEYWSLCVCSVWCTVSPGWLVPWSCSWAELQCNYQALHMFSVVLLFNQLNQCSPPMREHL